jgi:Predicted DNA-binding proteins
MSITEGFMARPVKCRKVCLLPKCDSFRPVGSGTKGEEVRLTVDEYETLRLIDYEGMNQEEAASLMEVARTTVQQIYSQARFKLSKMLVEGLPLEIEGGEYELCTSFDCPRKKCYKLDRIRKEKKMSVIAIPVNEAEKNSEVSPVFARAPYFALYDFEKKH